MIFTDDRHAEEWTEEIDQAGAHRADDTVNGDFENMMKFKIDDVVRWYLNPYEYVTGVVVEVCADGTYWVEHSNGQQRNYKGFELTLHKEQN